MPQVVKPSELSALVPSVNGSLCGKFLQLRQFPALFAQAYRYERDEQGAITTEFCADIVKCAGTGGTGTPGTGTGTLATPVVTATDGTFTDRVVVTWTAPTGATRYVVSRSLTNDSTTATKLSDVNGTNSYSDSTVEASTIYWYFVQAFNDTPAQSAISAGDSGYAGTLIPSLGAATDLMATKGIYPRALGAIVSLVWTKVADATAYDIYRNTVDDHTTATRIGQDRTPYVFSDIAPDNYGPSPQFVDNGTELCYHDTVATSGTDPNATNNLYYWVVAKRANPLAVGDFSTASGATAGSKAGALGWGYGQGGSVQVFAVNAGMTSGGAEQTIPAGATKAWVTFSGSFASGAGGNAGFGGGGGGAGVIITGLMDVASTGKFKLVSAPEADPGSGASATNGNDGPVTTLQYSADGAFDDTVSICVGAAPGAGQWNLAGGGLGGAGATGTADASLTPVNIYPGRDGFPAHGTSGGDSGFLFGSFRGPPAPLTVLDQFGNASGGHAGGGADNNQQSPASAIGGLGARGRAFLIFYQ